MAQASFSTGSRLGKGRTAQTPEDAQDQTTAERRALMNWAQRLRRVFNIDIESCSECGGDVRIIASIEDPIVIGKILTHLNDKVSSDATALLPECRAPPWPNCSKGFKSIQATFLPHRITQQGCLWAYDGI